MSTAEPFPTSVGVEGLYRAHRGDIYRFLRRELGNAADAEDATQTVFVNAHRSLVRGCVPAAPRAWLYAIARNVARRTWRDRCERPTSELDLESIPGDDASDELRRELVDALEALPERQREALLLHELGGLEYAEIARATNQSVAGVETAIFRARRACRAELTSGGALEHGAASKLLGRFVAGKLTRQEREALQKHIAICPDCAADERDQRAGRRRRGLLGWLLSVPEAIQRASALFGGPSPRGLAAVVVAVAATGGAATTFPAPGDESREPASRGTATATRATPTSPAASPLTRAAEPALAIRGQSAPRKVAPGPRQTATAAGAAAPVVVPRRDVGPSSPPEAPTAGSDPPTRDARPEATPSPPPEPQESGGSGPSAPTNEAPAPSTPVRTTFGEAVDTIEKTVGAVTGTVTTVVEQTPIVGPVVDTVAGPEGPVPLLPAEGLPPLVPPLPPLPGLGLGG